MCIILSTTNNPDYEIIMISNRDEVFERSSERLDFRDVVFDDGNTKKKLLMGLDNVNKGTWMCIDGNNKSFAIVLNVQSIDHKDPKQYSRGCLPLEVLKQSEHSNLLPSSFSEFRESYPKVDNTRFFKLIYAEYDKNLAYRLISLADDEIPVFKDLHEKGVFVTSNQYESDNIGVEGSPKWDKIQIGERLMKQLSSREDEKSIIEKCFQISEYSTFPLNEPGVAIEFVASKLKVRSSVFIPPHKIKINGKQFTYGTRTTTVVLVRKDGSMKIIERERTNPESKDRMFEM